MSSGSSSSSSKPRPIHTLHREIRTIPDEAEPPFSYEEPGFLSSRAEAAEDEFHRRISSGNNNHHHHHHQYRGSNSSNNSGAYNKDVSHGTSFWRSSNGAGGFDATTQQQQPSTTVGVAALGSLSSSPTVMTPAVPSRPTMLSAQLASSSSSSSRGGLNPPSSISFRTPRTASAVPAPSDEPVTTPLGRSLGLLDAALRNRGSTADDPQDLANRGNNRSFTLVDSPGTPASSSQHSYRKADSSLSAHSSSSQREMKKKEITKQRSADRRAKLHADSHDVGHIEEGSAILLPARAFSDLPSSIMTQSASAVSGAEASSTSVSAAGLSAAASPPPLQVPPNLPSRPGLTSLDRSSSDQSTSSLFYGKTPNSGALLGKSSSLIFPTMEASSKPVEGDMSLRRKINLLLDQCESVRFPFKKKLILSDLNLTAADIPLGDLCGTSLGNSLHKLTLAGNRLGTVPPALVQNLPGLRHLDLSQCELHHLPDKWNLPKLTRLNLSHNRLTDFPEEGMLEGLPELQELNMYGNKVAEIIIPPGRGYLSKLETLNLGYNDLAHLPDDLDQLMALRTLKVMNNFLEKIPMRVCDMDLRQIDVSSNPVVQPPLETCERGICSMKRYYHCLRNEEQSKQKAADEVNKKAARKKKPDKKKPYVFLKGLRRTSEDSQQSGQSGSSSDVLPPSSSRQVTESSLLGSQTSDHSQMGTVLETPPDSSKPYEVDTSVLSRGVSDLDGMIGTEGASSVLEEASLEESVSVNDTLKVIFVGMAMVGKTSMIKRLIEGRDAIIPTHDERTVGVDIYEWDPKKDQRYTDIDSRIVFQDKELADTCGDVNVKFSVWDFAGQHVYHATHELFFSPRALYVLVWDMGATNRATLRRKEPLGEESGAFKLTYDSSDDEEEEEQPEGALAAEEENKRADRALERDIDEKMQFWVDCIQSSAPGAAILPVASFADCFESEGGETEARRRCLILKQRLLKHEERRIQGIKERLRELVEQKRANDPAAVRLRKLLCTYTRPKLIFGDDDNDCVVRVSGTQYTGFRELTSKIIGIATGSDRGKCRYPIFHGHVGARIPRMRLEVRDAVRTMRDRFKVVEWGYFINQLSDRGLRNVEDISDALFFLTNIGELSYFGGVMDDYKDGRPCKNSVAMGRTSSTEDLVKLADETKGSHDEDLDDDDDDEGAILSMDDTSITAPSSGNGSLSTLDDFMSHSLSQFVFLNPRWLVAAVACILRHDLDREIKETRRQAALGGARLLLHTGSFHDAHLNCPVITSEDACLLWQAKRITKKAAERAQEYSNNMTITPFEFLQQLLIRFGVFVPIDLCIEKAFLGGKEYSHLLVDGANTTEEYHSLPRQLPTDTIVFPADDKAKFFFLPSLLGPSEPSDAWTYKSTDSWKTTLCHSVLFPDGVPPGLMERLTASMLSSMYAVAGAQRDTFGVEESSDFIRSGATYEGQLVVKEILCWRTASYLKIGAKAKTVDGVYKESIVEIFVHLADRDSYLCVGSSYMGVGMRRLIVSGRGQGGDGGRKTWKGGYLLVCKCINRVLENYGGLEFERHGFCPECLSKKAVSKASCWEFTKIRSAVMNQESTLRCQHGHQVDIRLVAGPNDGLKRAKAETMGESAPSAIPVQDLLRAVVVVGLWDGRTQKVVRVGSGFVVDKKRGLIVTASHTLMNIWGDKSYPYGEDYYGLRQGKVVIGVIPSDRKDTQGGKDMAVFRYFAKIVAKDPNLDNGECVLDTCVLKITTRLENDIGGDGEGCGEQPERLLLNDSRAMKQESLQSLKVTEKCELDEQVRILGYNQGGEGLLRPGESLNRCVDFARGYVCMKFAHGQDASTTTTAAVSGSEGSGYGGGTSSSVSVKTGTTGIRLRADRFKPNEEIVVICPTIGGHSGGPCVNQQGEVIGILSRADPAESQRCYISPTSEWKFLLKIAKNAM